MSVRRLDIANLGTVAFYKRRDARSIRLTITPTGNIRVSLPRWTPYRTAIEFVQSRQEWIHAHRPRQTLLLQDGDRIGKAHRLVFISNPQAQRTTARLNGNEIQITYPPGKLTWQDNIVQNAAVRGCNRALKHQAETLLPVRVEQLAAMHGFTYHSIKVKQLKSRWGSCDNFQKLTFNMYLMQLPWSLIDYVILHELQHTRILRHGPPFWNAIQECVPNVSQLRKTISRHQPVLIPDRMS